MHVLLICNELFMCISKLIIINAVLFIQILCVCVCVCVRVCVCVCVYVYVFVIMGVTHHVLQNLGYREP